jgi:hypothetical protein
MARAMRVTVRFFVEIDVAPAVCCRFCARYAAIPYLLLDAT